MLLGILNYLYVQTSLSTYLAIINCLSLVFISNYIATEETLSLDVTSERERANLYNRYIMTKYLDPRVSQPWHY